MPDYNVCRICLREEEDSNDIMQPLFDDNNERCSELVQQIEECGGIVLKRHEAFPRTICMECLEALQTSYKFRVLCKASENALLQSMVKSEVEIETAEGYVSVQTIAADVQQLAAQEPDIFFDLHNTEFIDAAEVSTAALRDRKVDRMSCSSEAAETDVENAEDFLSTGGSASSDTEIPVPPKRSSATKKKTQQTTRVTTRRTRALQQKRLNVKYLNRPGILHGKRQLRQRRGHDTSEHTEDAVGDTKDKSELDPNPIMCEICGNIYQKQSLLNMHRRRHMADKPFECEICSKTFACPSEIRRHMRVHTGEKPYVCRFCGRTFADRSTNIKHERTHTNERPFSCKTCGKSFTYSNVLKNHMLTHTGEKPFPCAACNKTFSRKHQLDQHIATLTHQQTVKNQANRAAHVLQAQSTHCINVEELLLAARH